MRRRSPDGTVQQRVFDAIVKAGCATHAQIKDATGLSSSSVRIALYELRKIIPVQTCKQPAQYSIPANTPRPNDGRGHKAGS